MNVNRDLTMLDLIIKRVRRVEGISEIWIATTSREYDSPIREFCNLNGIHVFSGAEYDVLSRYETVCEYCAADWCFRLTGDNPLVSPQLMSLMINQAVNSSASYVSDNKDQRNYPQGMVPELIKVELLQKIRSNFIRADYDLVHVTSAIPNSLRTFLLAPQHLKPLPLRLTVDEEEDLHLIRTILTSSNLPPALVDVEEVRAIYSVIPEIFQINSLVQQKSIEEG